MSPNLTKIRNEIEAIKAKIAETTNALPPLEDRFKQLTVAITDLTSPLDRFVNHVAEFVTNTDDPISGRSLLQYFDVEDRERLSLAAGLVSLQVDRLAGLVRDRAKEVVDVGQVRLTATARAEKLSDLRRKLYALELREESERDGEPRRPDANAAAIMGVPLDVVEAAGLLEYAK